jgi:glycosyltransferase involved in cell wall biosynthesis
VSRYAAGVLARRYRVDRAKLRVVHNATERRRAPRRRRRPPGAPPTVLFLGRITAQKGPRTFLEAAAIVAAAEPAVRFVMAGSGDLFADTVERAARMGLADRVHFTGFLRGRDVARAYAMADVFVMPSVSEPFGIAPLEALAHGVPAVVSRQSGVAEVVGSARRVDARDARGLARVVLSLLRRPAARRRLVQRGRREVARLSWERQARVLERVYREVVP